jgi:predicted PurR-regulated permease PerM
MAKETARRPEARSSRWHAAAPEIARIVALGAGVVAIVALLWFARTALLLLFAGILLAVLLDAMCRPIMRGAGLSKPAALALVLAVVGILAFVTGLTSGPVLMQQLEELGHNLAKAIGDLTEQAATQAGQNAVLQGVDWPALISWLPTPLGIASGATAVATTIGGVVASILIVVFLGVYLALDPETYVRLVLRFAPAERCDELQNTLVEIGEVLRKWLSGQLLAMAVVGLITYVGLLILGVPLSLVLALLIGLFEFIPYIGPILGAAPMLLVAAGEGLDMLIWVAGLYLLVQLLESYVITPLIQSRAVSLPPVVVIMSQLVFGAIFGVLGIALATPLVAAASVPVRRYFGADIRA